METKKSTLELKKIIDCVACICLSCRQMVLAPIYGLFEKESGLLVSVMKGQEKELICKQCEEKIRLAEKKEKRFLIMKTLDVVELRTFIREEIIPELIRGIERGEFKICIESEGRLEAIE